MVFKKLKNDTKNQEIFLGFINKTKNVYLPLFVRQQEKEKNTKKSQKNNYSLKLEKN